MALGTPEAVEQSMKVLAAAGADSESLQTGLASRAAVLRNPAASRIGRPLSYMDW